MKTKEELKKAYSDNIFRLNFKHLFSLRTFYRYGIVSKDFIVDPKIDEYVVLTKEGESLFRLLKEDRFKSLENYEIKYSIFLEFYHEELFVDVEKTNYPELRDLLSECIKAGSIKFPWIYGRVLYDKYFDEFDNQDEILNNDDVLKLLQDTSQGVFQLGSIIVGPFGILESNIERYIPPTFDVNLWHCSDPSCSVFHSVKLKSGNTKLLDMQSEITKLLSTINESSWASFYYDLIQSDEYYYDINRLTEIHVLLMNAFGGNEIKELLAELIDYDKSLRKKFPTLKKLQGSASSIVNSLSKAECFQLMLLVEEKNLIICLERLIEDNKIFIPPTEIRGTSMRLHGGFYNIFHQCNKLGIRSVSDLSNQCVIKLVNYIEMIYDDDASKKDLEYRLMQYKKDSFKETIENYVLHEEPENIIREVLLSGYTQTEKSINGLYGNFKIPTNENEKNYLVSKFLWKLGFRINMYPQTLQFLWEKIDSLIHVTQNSGDNFTENEKEGIRSVAVNLFVLLEEVLEHTLSFITWTLLSDHFINTKFRYNFEEARDFMCSQLNGHTIGSNEPLRFDNTGNNTLYPLTEGFKALIEICDKYISDGREKYDRTDNETPHFHQKTNFMIFPFVSKLHLFNIKQSQYEEMKSILLDFQREFAQCSVLSVRNKLEHKERATFNKNGFPTKEEIIVACNCIKSQFNKIVSKGIYPNVFLFKNSQTDKFNRRRYELEDCEGKKIVIKPILQFLANKLPEYTTPQVISSIFTIGNSMEPLRFKHEESSEYLKFWKDFPRKSREMKDQSDKQQIETSEQERKSTS